MKWGNLCSRSSTFLTIGSYEWWETSQTKLPVKGCELLLEIFISTPRIFQKSWRQKNRTKFTHLRASFEKLLDFVFLTCYYLCNQWIQTLVSPSVQTSRKPSCFSSLKETLQNDSCLIAADRKKTTSERNLQRSFFSSSTTSPSYTEFNLTSHNK